MTFKKHLCSWWKPKAELTSMNIRLVFIVKQYLVPTEDVMFCNAWALLLVSTLQVVSMLIANWNYIKKGHKRLKAVLVYVILLHFLL